MDMPACPFDGCYESCRSLHVRLTAVMRAVVLGISAAAFFYKLYYIIHAKKGGCYVRQLESEPFADLILSHLVMTRK